MPVYHVVAIANNRVIGKNNKLPWHFPADLKFFKELTTGSTVIMGRKTFESIGKPLPNRKNFVLTTAAGLGFKPAPAAKKENLKFFNSLDQALRNVSCAKLFIIGGAKLYEQTMDRIDGIFLTRIHADYEGDAFYPEIPSFFQEKWRKKLQDNPKIDVTFYEKR